MTRPAAILGSLALLASLAVAGQTPVDRLRAAVAAKPASAELRWQLAQALTKAGLKRDAQRACWAAYLLADKKQPLRSQAREALLRLDKRWQALFDLEKQQAAGWKKLARELRTDGGPTPEQIAALWSRVALVIDEEWNSTRDPLADFSKLIFQWKGNKLLGKGGVPLLDMPARQRNGFAGRTVVVEALEITIEGNTYSKEPELEVTAQVGTGEVKWGKPGEDPKAPVWVHARRLGSWNDPMQPIKFWLRYYPAKGIGVGAPLVDPRMRGSGHPIKLDKPLTASVRLESLLPKNRIQITTVTLTLYLRATR